MDNKKLIEEIVKKLDITPTMYKNAKEKYEALAVYLQDKGVKCDIYPQGSFAVGTVIRPIKDGKDSDYDLDMICKLALIKEDTTTAQVKWAVGKPLMGNKRYLEKGIKEYNRCWTIKFGNVDGEVGFSMDIVPCVHENYTVINEVIKRV